MKKIFIILPIVALLAACGQPDFKSEPIQMTVVKHTPDPSNWGCVGKNVRTVLRSEDGRTADLCGDIGNDGDKISGCWETGHHEELFGSDTTLANGFHLVCNK